MFFYREFSFVRRRLLFFNKEICNIEEDMVMFIDKVISVRVTV